MKFERSSGILLHPTSLFGSYGIGDLGSPAYQWVDWLCGSGCKLWQVLPLGPTGYGDSPYQCFSAFAGNPYLISPEFLLEQGILVSNDFDDMPAWDPLKVDFGQLYKWKPLLLEKGFSRFIGNTGINREHFDSFRSENQFWLDDFSLFMALKEANGGGAWDGWSKELRHRDPDVLREARKKLEDSVLKFMFLQFLFFEQWNNLKTYANKQGLQIIGDIPIFVAFDSSDVWAHQELFYLGEDSRPTVVAGVPPDYFSPTGQLWGNPLYRWDVHSQSGYSWWLKRIGFTLRMVDILRIDHFRGFAGYWEIPGTAVDAVKGRWVPGPGAEFFDCILNNLGDLPIIAEDLGEITTDVIELRDRFLLPGMKILQFAFSGPDNPFLPHHFHSNSIVYTGTHDNDTAHGWFIKAPEKEKEFAGRYFRRGWNNGREFAWDMIRTAWASAPVFALAPLQDFLTLGSEARFNFPSRLGNNWDWRFGKESLSDGLQKAIRELNWLFSR